MTAGAPARRSVQIGGLRNQGQIRLGIGRVKALP